MSLERDRVLREVAAAVPDPTLRAAPVRVAVDGVDGAGKTVFADALAQTLTRMGREVVRISIDGFHAPRAHRYSRGRFSPEGFWLDSYDYEAFHRLVLAPFSQGGVRTYRRAVREVVTDAVVHGPWERTGELAVLVVDGIFLHRDELVDARDFSVFVDIDAATSVARMAHRDGASSDPDDPRNRRYLGGQQLYLRSADPVTRASMVIDNADYDAPVVRRR